MRALRMREEATTMRSSSSLRVNVLASPGARTTVWIRSLKRSVWKRVAMRDRIFWWADLGNDRAARRMV